MDKKRIICLCTTYFQLITAIQMRRTLFSEDYFDIVITDGSNKAQQYSEKLREMKIFDEVFFVTRERDSQEGFSSIGSKISRFCNYFVKGSYVSYLKHPYDLFLSYSFYWYSFMLFNALEQDNHNIKVAKYEEGLISYYVDDHRFEYDYFLKIRKIKRLLRQPVMFDRYKDFYCFYPEFYEGKLHTIKIPVIDREDKEFRDILCTMFDVNPDKLCYDKKFIYFASMLDREILEGRSGEFDILKSIVKVVGKENIMVKLHPRENEPQRYEELGVTIDENSDIPFEVVQLVRDFSNNVFITCLSGSVINFASILPKQTTTYLTYGMLPEKIEAIKTICDMFDKTIANMEKATDNRSFIVLNSEEQMKKELEGYL